MSLRALPRALEQLVVPELALRLRRQTVRQDDFRSHLWSPVLRAAQMAKVQLD